MWSISWDSSSCRDSDGHLQSSRDPRPICLYTFTKWPTYVDDMRSRGWWRWVDNNGPENKYREATHIMMTSSNGNIFHVTGTLCGEFTGHRWIPRTKASDAELWCFLWSATWINGWVNSREAGGWFEAPMRSLWRHCNVYLTDDLNQEKYRFLVVHQASTFWIREHQCYMEMQVEITSKWNDFNTWMLHSIYLLIPNWCR